MDNPIDDKFIEGMKELELKGEICLSYKANKTVIDCVKHINFNFENYKKIIILGIGGIDTMVAAEYIKHKYKRIKFDVFFYVVGAYDLCYDMHPIFLKIAGKFRKSKKLIKRLLENNSLVFMDDQCLEYTEKKRKEFDFATHCQIIRLPMVIPPEISFQKINQRFNQQHKKIITCTRMDFPFKEYVLGLIDSFEYILKFNENIELNIIGNGGGLDRLKEKINSKSQYVKDKIKLLPPVKYSELSNFFDEGYVYIGMGTTLLDACSVGLPCMLAYPYNEACETNGLFSEEWGNLGNFGEKRRGESVVKYLLEILEMNRNEYYECSLKCYETYRMHYNIDNIMSEWLKKENCLKKPILSYSEIVIYNYGIKIISFIRKLMECKINRR